LLEPELKFFGPAPERGMYILIKCYKNPKFFILNFEVDFKNPNFVVIYFKGIASRKKVSSKCLLGEALHLKYEPLAC
jgi:hypothetical protein